jgi:hypothetical protein
MVLFCLFVLLTSLVLVVIRLVQAAHAVEGVRGQMARANEAGSCAVDGVRAAIVLVLGCELKIEQLNELAALPNLWPAAGSVDGRLG